MKRTITICVVFLPLVILTAYADVKSVGYMSASRTYWGYGLNDYSMTRATNDVLAQGYTLISIDEFSPSSLAGIDVAFVGLGSAGVDGALPASEVTSLYDFVLGGGVLILFGENTSFSSFQNSVANAFGVYYGGEGSYSYTYNTSHPIMRGPYGEVTSYYPDGNDGQIIDLGPYAVSLIDNKIGASTAAIIDNNVLCNGSGHVIFLTDVDGFADPPVPGFEDHRNIAIWNNIFAYTVPEPATLVLLGLGGFALRFKQSLRG